MLRRPCEQENPISRPYRIAVVGLGKIALDQHLPAIASNPDFVLTATVDQRPGASPVPAFTSLDALLASGPAIDAVAICTPPQVRAGIAHRAIDAGLAVLLEKPPAASLEEFASLKGRAEAGKLSLFAAWHSRFAPRVAEARTWLDRHRVSGGRIRWCEDVRRWHPGQRWLWQPGGLGVFDPGINALSILTALLPTTPALIRARLEVPANAQTPIAAQLSLAAGRASIEMELDFLNAGTQAWDIRLDTEDGHKLLLSDGGVSLSIDGGPASIGLSAEYPALYAHFASLIASGASDADAAPLALVLDALSTGRVHAVEPFIE
jgi:D-galactose 1-dehydrogenase